MIVVTLKGLLVAIFCIVLCVPVFAQNSTLTEWPIPTADSWPLHLVAGSNTTFYFSESAKNTVAQLNTATNMFVEFRLPAGSMPHGLVLNPSSNQLIFCAFNGNYLGFLNLKTGAFTGWPVPTKNSGTIHLDLSTGGSVFFTEANGNKIGFLNPSTAQITEWLIPTTGALPRGIAVGQGSQVFVVELGVGKIAMLDTSANTITEWVLPSVYKDVEHLRFSGGQVYFGDGGSSWLGILDPVSGILTSWQSPSVNAAIPDVFVSSGSIDFTERQSNKIGLLNPSQQAGMTQTLVPIVNQVPPVFTAVKSQLLHGTLVETKVTPKSTPVTGVVTGGFTEWPIPTPGSQPLGIVQVGTSVGFTEYIGNNIGVLVPSQKK